VYKSYSPGQKKFCDFGRHKIAKGARLWDYSARRREPWRVDETTRDLRRLRTSRELRHRICAEECATEEELYRVADDVVHQLKRHGDPWRLLEELTSPSEGH